jgi:hypothetical protein
MRKMDHKMTFFETTVNKVAMVHQLQKIKVQRKDQWLNFLVKLKW